jgi:hypothetical protein
MIITHVLLQIYKCDVKYTVIIVIFVVIVIQHLYCLGFTAAEAVDYQLDTTKASVLFQSGPFALCAEQSGTGRGFSPST